MKRKISKLTVLIMYQNGAELTEEETTIVQNYLNRMKKLSGL